MRSTVASGEETEMLRRVNKKERLDCLLTLPNSVVHHVSLPDDSTGYDCLEKVRISLLC